MSLAVNLGIGTRRPASGALPTVHGLHFLGASIVNSAVSDGTDLFARLEASYPDSTWQVTNHAVSGHTATQTASLVSGLAIVPGDHYVVHTGGNDVNLARPFSSASESEKDAITDSLTAIRSYILSGGGIPVFLELSYRNYGGLNEEINGSGPFNDNLLLPLFQSWSDPYHFADGVSLFQSYQFTKQDFGDYLNPADGIHLTLAGDAAWRQRFVDTIGLKIATGAEPSRQNELPNDGLVLNIDAADTGSITDAGGGNVSAISDKSGRGFDATQAISGNRPQTGMASINGRNVLSFTQLGNSYLTLGQPAALDIVPNSDEFTWLGVWSSQNAGYVFGKAGGTGGLRQYGIYAFGGSAQQDGGWIGGTDLGGLGAGLQNVPHISGQRVRGSTPLAEALLDGAIVDSRTSFGSAINSCDVLIGGRRANDANGGIAFTMDGRLGQVLAWNRRLSDDEMYFVMQYLAAKWGIAHSWPAPE